jgi:hypothetical protein
VARTRYAIAMGQPNINQTNFIEATHGPRICLTKMFAGYLSLSLFTETRAVRFHLNLICCFRLSLTIYKNLFECKLIQLRTVLKQFRKRVFLCLFFKLSKFYMKLSLNKKFEFQVRKTELLLPYWHCSML